MWLQSPKWVKNVVDEFGFVVLSSLPLSHAFSPQSENFISLSAFLVLMAMHSDAW